MHRPLRLPQRSRKAGRFRRKRNVQDHPPCRVVGTAAAFAFAPAIVGAQKKYDPGVTDKEIKLGHTNPYSGPLSAYGVIGKGITAYWQMVNDNGGINGRKINFITYDDGFLPPKTVEMVRKLVEDDQVFAIYQLLGTPTNTVVQKYLNQKKVPQLFVATGASKWGIPRSSRGPWAGSPTTPPRRRSTPSTSWRNACPNGQGRRCSTRTTIRVRTTSTASSPASGKEKDKFLIKTASYEVTDPTVDSQIIQLKDSGADVLFNDAAPKAAAQAIRKVADLGWKPRALSRQRRGLGRLDAQAGRPRQQQGHHHRGLPQGSDRSAMGQRAGLPRMEGVDGEVPCPQGNLADAVVHLCLRRVGDDAPRADRSAATTLTRANLMKQAASMKDLVVPLLLPGIKINTSPTDFYPIQSVQLARFDGETWKLFGDVLSNESS